jgi:hypothetical protein
MDWYWWVALACLAVWRLEVRLMELANRAARIGDELHALNAKAGRVEETLAKIHGRLGYDGVLVQVVSSERP